MALVRWSGVLVLGGFLVAGCFGGGENELRARAAYEFNCPKESLELTELQEKNWGATTNHGAVYGVAGCGHRATYVNNVGTWVLNGSDDGVGERSKAKSAPSSKEQ